MIALLLLVKLFETFVLADNRSEPSDALDFIRVDLVFKNTLVFEIKSSISSGIVQNRVCTIGENHGSTLVTVLQVPALTRRVLYGERARIEDYPYFASLGDCGGAILSQIWIATAAHCVADAESRGLQIVYVGGNTILDSITHSYIDFVVHPEYNDTNSGIALNDIALIKLNAPLQFSEKIQPAQLPTGSAPRNVVLVTRGTDETGKTSIYLTKVDRLVLSDQECSNKISSQHNDTNELQNVQELEKKMLCTIRRENLPSVCRGDSGSPLLSGNTLIGIHTAGAELCQEGKLGFATYVLNYVPWIRAQIGL